VLRSTQPPTLSGTEMSSCLWAMGWRPSVADWGSGMSASGNHGSDCLLTWGNKQCYFNKDVMTTTFFNLMQWKAQQSSGRNEGNEAEDADAWWLRRWHLESVKCSTFNTTQHNTVKITDDYDCQYTVTSLLDWTFIEPIRSEWKFGLSTDRL